MRPQTDNTDYPVVAGCSEAFFGVLLGLIACLLISLCSCKSGKTITEYVEKPVIVTQEHHTESVKIDVIRDTICQRDSVYHYIKGDTTIIERWHYYTTNNNAVRIDTLVRVDSVQVPVITEKVITQVNEVEKPLRWYQKALIALGGLCLILLSLFIVYKVGQKAQQK